MLRKFIKKYGYEPFIFWGVIILWLILSCSILSQPAFGHEKAETLERVKLRHERVKLAS